MEKYSCTFQRISHKQDLETICQFLVRDIGVWLPPMKVAAYRSLFDWSWESLRATLAGDTYEERPTVEVCSHSAVVSISPLTAAMFQGGGIKAQGDSDKRQCRG